MKKSIWILGLSLVLLLTFGINVQAQSKEVSETGITAWFVTSTKTLPLGEGIVYMSYEAIGLGVNDTGRGLFHNATARTLGALKIEKGIYDDRGRGVFNLQNGDKVFFTYTVAGEAKPGGVGSGTVTITGGSGKAAGIEGSFEVTRTVVRSVVEGVGQNYTKGKIRYTLP
jgi:uncharacterized membrane protein YhdT